VRGTRILDFYAPLAQGKLLGLGGDILRIDHLDRRGVSVLLQFADNVGCVIPAIQGFIAALTVDEGELVDVAYEPSDNSERWQVYQQHASQVRALRAVAASASHHGRFRLDQNNASTIGRAMQLEKGIDPTLAVYAAYAYHDLQAIDRIRTMSAYLLADLNITFFDLELLGRQLIDTTVGRERHVLPFVPLFSQGWPLLQAHRVKLHPALDGIEQNMRDSLWSVFDDAGVRQLKRAMATGDVQ
jgi:hypothetical protein